MKEVVIALADIINEIHDILIAIFGLHLNDKELHFWIIGIFGMITFFVVYILFKWIEKMKWSITILSFIYTFTCMVVLVFAIELQQAITNRGNMEFADAVAGLWGFLVLFMIYAMIGLVYYGMKKLVDRRK